MPITSIQLEGLGFFKTEARIKLVNNRLQYLANIKNDINGLNTSGVYLMVIVHPEAVAELKVLYVGKAGAGLNRRLYQHQAGYQRKIRSDPEYREHKLERTLSQLNVSEAQVWFRPSTIISFHQIIGGDQGREICLSQFSLEEEAFILYLQNMNEPLINSSLPSRQPCEDPMQTRSSIPLANIGNANMNPNQAHVIKMITDNISTNSPDQLERWNQSTAEWNDETKNNFGQVLDRLQKHTLMQERTAKIIGEYTSGPFRNQPILVFGELKQPGGNFSAGTNQLMLTLDGQYIAMYPFDLKRITVQTLADFLEL